MEISFDPLQCLGALLGLIVLGLTVAGINGIIRLLSRIAQGPEQIQAMIMVVPIATIQKYASQALSTSTDGKSVLNTQVLMFKLFSQAANNETIQRWAASGKVSLLLITEPIDDPDSAARLAIGKLRRDGMSTQTLRKSKVYWIQSRGTEKELTAYLVIVGNIPKPPPQITIEFGE